MLENLKKKGAGRVIIVSNRLPFTFEKKQDGFDLASSSGGLATGLGSFYETAVTTWVGWPGAVPKHKQNVVCEELRAKHRCEPVFLSDRLVEKFYEGFANRAIWPVLHSFQSYGRFAATEWNAYVEANQLFLQTLETVLKPGDQVWIHDYQLMLLPSLLRQRRKDVSIGFFLHVPFPSFDVLRVMPQHKDLLRGLLGADVIGFHTNDYARAFLGSLDRAFGLQDRLGQVTLGDRAVQTLVHPMGIDFDAFANPTVDADRIAEDSGLLSTFADQQVIFSVSRLDYTKGIPQMLYAFELLLERRPELHKKIAFVLSVVPSREKVDRYAQLKREIDEAVGRINSRFGRVNWTPIRYLYRHLSFDELVMLYRKSHVGLVAPLRDGMNLVAKEFVAARIDEDGILILSELAGAAKELTEALLVNPNDREETTQALSDALDMKGPERRRRMSALRERLLDRPIQSWGEKFIDKLTEIAALNDEVKRDSLDGSRLATLVARGKTAQRRLFLLDYDGTLVPFAGHPAEAKPDERLRTTLERLAWRESDEVMIVSGRRKGDLDSLRLPPAVTLVAEHGGYTKKVGHSWTPVGGHVDVSWKKEVRATLQAFVDMIPGSWIEDKDCSLVWHYRKSERDSADNAAKDLVFHLLGTLREKPVRILPGSRSIEVRSQAIGKGTFLNGLDLDRFDFILVAGDDLTDEDMFAAAPAVAATIKVGNGFTAAAVRVRDYLELRKVLEELAEADEVAQVALG